ncbi:MAG TPA: putative holin-like toxin [Bacilli bacterium]
MELKDTFTIMILFATLVVGLLTYISNNYKKNKSPPPRLQQKVGF